MATNYLSTDPMAGTAYRPSNRATDQPYGGPEVDPRTGMYSDAQGLHNADGSIATWDQIHQAMISTGDTVAQRLGMPPVSGQPNDNIGAPTTGGTGGIMLPGQQTGPASGGTAPQVTNPSDPNQVRAFFQWRASQQGADPYLSQPGGVDYYTQKALENGGLTDQNYWTHKSTLAQFGGAVGAGGGQGGGNLSGGFGDTWNKLPSLQDAMNMPGLQFALDRGSNAIQRSAFAHGTGLSGGMLKDLGEWNTGTALQGYGNLANLNLSYNQANAGNLLSLGDLGQRSSTVSATGRPA